MTAKPYREMHLQGGVALARRGIGSWETAVVSTALLQIVLYAWAETRTGLLYMTTAWLGVVVMLAIKVANGRSPRPGRLLAAAIAPIAVAEANAHLPLVRYGLGGSGSMLGPPIGLAGTLDDLAVDNLVVYASAAVALAVVAVACVAFVANIDGRQLGAPPRARWNLVAASLAVVLGIALDVMRLRDTHRDGLGGALAGVALFGTGTLAATLPSRARRLADWHDRAEARAVTRGAIVAVASVGLAGLSAERAVLAYDEHRSLFALTSAQMAFDVRVDWARALASAWQEHGIALAIVAMGIVIALLPFVRRPRTSDATWALAAIGATCVLALVSVARQRRLLVPSFDRPTPASITPPVAPGLPPRALHVAVPIFVDTSPTLADGNDDCLLFFDRATRNTDVIGIRKKLACRAWLFVEGGSPQGFGKAEALVGPHTSALPFDLPTADTSAAIAILVLDDGEVARVTKREDGHLGPTRGASLRRDPESRQAREKLRRQLGGAPVITLWPHPAGDAQALVDAMIAARELAPEAKLTITTEARPEAFSP